MKGREYIILCTDEGETLRIPIILYKKWVRELTIERVLEVGLSLDDLKKVKAIMSKESLVEDLDKIPYSFILLAAFDIITSTPIKQEEKIILL